MRPIRKDTRGNYMTVRFPNITQFEDPRDVEIVSDASTRLDMLALSYYGDQRHWKVIAWYSGVRLPTVEVGTVIKIPYRLSDILKTFTELNK